MQPAPPRPRRPAPAPVVALLACALAPACATPKERRAEADRAAYLELSAKRTRVPEVVGDLDLDQASLRGRAARAPAEVVLDLEGALRLAAAASREYLNAREDAYLAALSLTQERHAFETQLGLGAVGAVAKDANGSSGTLTPEASVSRRLETGGSFVLSLATDFLKNLAGDPLTTARSILSAELVIPLARGSSRLEARESLTQSERDTLYALRSYARFQQDFTVRVASAFFQVVERRDTIGNEDLTYKSLELVFARAKEFGPDGAGRLADFEVDQARQDLLRSEQRGVLARQGYEEALDAFKLDLGLPIGTHLVIRDDALETLKARGLVDPDLDLALASRTALERRLDLRNARDQREDAERKLEIARLGLGAQVDLTLGGDLTGPNEGPFAVKGARGSGRAGIGLSLPIERTAERNQYRAAEIALERARRAVEGLEDRVGAEIRQAWRTLSAARRSYELQQEGLRLATRRVESADLNLQAGKATTRDLLEAEQARVEARNALTASLVAFAVARLELERDAGILRPDETAAGRSALPSKAAPTAPTPTAPGSPPPPPEASSGSTPPPPAPAAAAPPPASSR